MTTPNNAPGHEAVDPQAAFENSFDALYRREPVKTDQLSVSKHDLRTHGIPADHTLVQARTASGTYSVGITALEMSPTDDTPRKTITLDVSSHDGEADVCLLTVAYLQQTDPLGGEHIQAEVSGPPMTVLTQADYDFFAGIGLAEALNRAEDYYSAADVTGGVYFPESSELGALGGLPEATMQYQQ